MPEDLNKESRKYVGESKKLVPLKKSLIDLRQNTQQ